MLENMAIEKACKRMTEEQMDKLVKAAREFEDTMADGNLVHLAEADVAFHEIIYQASDNRRLIQVLNNLREQIYRYRVEYLKEEETRKLLVKEHEELCQAIRERNVEKACEISFRHIENQRMAIIESIEAEKAGKEPAKNNKKTDSGYSKRDAGHLSIFMVKNGSGRRKAGMKWKKPDFP